MLKTNNNFKKRICRSSQSFRNKGSYPGCAGCDSLDEQRRTGAYLRNCGWILATVAVFSSFSYLTFIPTQAFAESLIVDENEKRSLSQIDTMQEMSQQICINSREEESKPLRDTRDDKVYWVAKLADGNCWMTQNLAYSGTDKDGVKIGDIGTPCTINNGSCSGWVDSNGVKYFAIGKHANESHSSQGNFYNWQAAVQKSSSDETKCVCPKNWQLPAINGDKSFNGLIDAYKISGSANHDKLTGSPIYFQYGGSISSGTLNNVDIYGYYWSSTAVGVGAHSLFFSGSSVQLSSGVRDNGFSVRCLAEGGWLGSYPELSGENQANVAITISPVISIDVTKDANDMTVDFTKVATSTIIARVGSNQPYQVLLSTDKSDLTNPDTDKTIPIIPSEQTIVKGTNSWGIKKLSSPTDTEVNENTIYSPVGINGNKELFYISASAASEDLTFPVAIAVDSSLPSGQYSTQVTLTAVAI